MCTGKKHKHMKGEFMATGKYDTGKRKKIKVGDTEFVKDQWEEGVAKKLKGSSKTSLFYVHGRK